MTDEQIAAISARMEAKGLVPLSQILACQTPLDRFMAHDAVKDHESFGWWLEMRAKEAMSLRASYELGDEDKNDEMYEWVFSLSAAFMECLRNWKQANARMAEASPLEPANHE